MPTAQGISPPVHRGELVVDRTPHFTKASSSRKPPSQPTVGQRLSDACYQPELSTCSDEEATPSRCA